MAVPSISTYIISNGSHRYGSIGGAAVMTSPSDSVTKVSAIISQTSGGAAIETVETTVKTSSDQFADRWALSWPTTGITSSPYYVKMWATNADGNGPTREAAPYIYFPPTVAITSPANGSTLASASVTMAWTASDPYGISAQRVAVLHGADVLLDEAVGESDTSYAVPSSVAFLDGESYTFRVTARNGNGMEASADSTVAFSFDAPAAASVTITDDGATATITVDDPHYSESGATISVDGSAIADSFTVFGNSTQDGTPTPSAPVAIESVEPRNILQVTSSQSTINYVTFTPQDDGTVLVNGTASAAGFYSCASINLDAGTYAFSGYANGTLVSTQTHYRIYIYIASQGIAANSGTSFTLTQSASATVYIQTIAGQTFDAETVGVQLEHGSTIHGYMPYGVLAVSIKDADNVTTDYPIDLQGNALRSLPDGTRDELRVDADGHAVLVQRVGEWDVSALASSANWAKSGSAINGYYLNGGNFSNMKSYQGGAIVCNVATAASSVSEYFNTLNSCWSDGSVNLNLDPSVVGSTLPDFKTWLATAGVKIVAKLATEQEIDLGSVSDMPFIPEDGEMCVDGTTMEASLRPADYAGQPPISSVDIARVNPDGTWTLAQGVTEGQSAIDPLPPLGVAYRYALTSHAAGGGMKVAYAEHTVETRAWHLNFGDAAQEHVSYLYNPQATMTLAQGGESYHFADGGAGRGLPVFYPTTDRDMSGTLRFDTVLYGDSDILLDLCDRYPVAWLRDPFGHRWRAHVRPSVSHGTGQVWPVTIAWDAVRFEEV